MLDNIELTPPLRYYGINRAKRQATIDWLADGLESAGARIVHAPDLSKAPFVFVIGLPWTGERIGVVVYAFTATSVATRNRPSDEARFQIKYGAKQDNGLHHLFLDPLDVWLTLLLGVDVERGVVVSCDPRSHSPTRMFVSIEFKREHIASIQRDGWSAWERERRDYDRRRKEFVAEEQSTLTETMVGCTQDRLLDLLLFERAAAGITPEYRLGLAKGWKTIRESMSGRGDSRDPTGLLSSLGLSERDLLQMIAGAPRLAMAVRGWTAQRHLATILAQDEGIASVMPIERDGEADLEVSLRRSPMDRPSLRIECKNARSVTLRDGTIKVDFMRTRAPKGFPCGRYYSPEEFEVLAVCLHPITKSWEFRYRSTRKLRPHPTCDGRLHHLVLVDESWSSSLVDAVAEP